jgi:hypothetical protein
MLDVLLADESCVRHKLGSCEQPALAVTEREAEDRVRARAIGALWVGDAMLYVRAPVGSGALDDV